MDYTQRPLRFLASVREALSANRIRLLLLIAAVFLFLSGYVAGRYMTLRQVALAPPVETPVALAVDQADALNLPTHDVTGGDIEGLPRYPGAVRVEYRYVVVDDLAETEVEYVVAADLDAVHDYYRAVFDEEGWIVADLGIYQGEWTFFIVSGEQEALLELEVRQSLVEIEIELSEPVDQSDSQPRAP